MPLKRILRGIYGSSLSRVYYIGNFTFTFKRHTGLGWGGPAAMTLTLASTGKFYKILRELHADVYPAGDGCCV